MNLKINNQKSKIFGIGLPRSGTTSLNTALSMLGYNALHHPTYYIIEKLNGSFSFDGNWDALTNFGEFFYPQLDQAFPHSKFILTVRDKEKWLDSCRWKYKDPSNHLGNAIRISIFGCDRFHETTFSHIYDQHLQNVLDYFKNRPNDLLVINYGIDDGWEKICYFLNKPIPDVPFPNKNSKQEITLSGKPINYSTKQKLNLSQIHRYLHSEILNQAFLGNSLAKVIINSISKNFYEIKK